MPLEVHCPNPGCAQKHWVKSKYAGQRGRCPACKQWMFVPYSAPAAAQAPPPTGGNVGFGWAATLLLVVGMAGLALAAVVPSLPQTRVEVTGDHAALLATVPTHGLRPEVTHVVTGLPLLACLLPMLALLSGAWYRQTNGWSQLFTGLAALVASALAFAALVNFQAESQALAGLREWYQTAQQSGKQGDFAVSMGCYLQTAVLGTLLASGSFFLAAFCLYRAIWARVLAVVVLGLPVVAGPLWLYADELVRLGLLPV